MTAFEPQHDRFMERRAIEAWHRDRESGSHARIAVVVAVKNGARTIEECLRSVLEQTLEQVELVVIDGDSRDGTTDILNNYGEHLTYWASAPDTGVYQAWNRALAHVGADWVLFLGADDRLYSSETLALASERLRALAEVERIAYGSVMWHREDGRTEPTWGSDWTTAGRRFRLEMTLPHQATFHHASLFHEFGGFNESYRIAGDYEFMLRVRHDVRPRFIPGLTVTLKRPGGLADQPLTVKRKRLEVARAQIAHGLTWAVPLTMCLDLARDGRETLRRLCRNPGYRP